MTISAQAHQGLTEVLRKLRQLVETSRQKLAEATDEQPDENDDIPVIRIDDVAKEDEWTVEREQGVYVVRGAKIEKFARRTNFEQFQSVNRLRDIMRRHGISHEITRQGGQSDSLVRIGDAEFTLVEQ